MTWSLYRFRNYTQRSCNAFKTRLWDTEGKVQSFTNEIIGWREDAADTVGDTAKFTVAVDNEKTSTSVNTWTNTPLDCKEINYWDLYQTNC